MFEDVSLGAPETASASSCGASLDDIKGKWIGLSPPLI
jgi:hypothetical protein